MAIQVKHSKVSTIPDTDDTSLVRPSDWNADHVLTGTIPVANGGTGADNPTDARTNLSAAKSGANSDITSMTGVTGGISSPDYIQFDTTYATPLTQGQLGWDGNNTLAVGMAGGNVIQHIGEDSFIYIKADAAITKGQVIMFTGAVGASGVLTGAPATGVTNPQYIMGIAAEDLAHNAFGLVQVFGELTGINTNSFNEGDILYYDSAVTGGLTNVFPTSGPIVLVAAVAKKAIGNGTLVIRVSVTQRITAGAGATITQANTGTTVAVTNPYNPASVAITGGTINGTTIGATTPAAGTFTTITGQTEVLRGTGQNLLLQSQTVDNASWTKERTTISADSSVAPNGTTTADTITADGTSGTHTIAQSISFVNGLTYTYSAFIKAGTNNFAQLRTVGSVVANGFANFDLSNGVLGTVGAGVTASITSTGSGWYRCSITFTSIVTASNPVYTLIVTSATAVNAETNTLTTSLITWGQQLEIGSVVNTYIPTTTTAVYGTPTLSFSGVAGLGLQSDGSLYVSPAGTGAIQAQATTSTSAGGNARGANAVDWQTIRSTASQVASATQAVITGGFGNTASGYASVVTGGESHSNAAYNGFIGGGSGNTLGSNAQRSVITGGVSNTANGFLNFIGGGALNSGTSGSAVTTQTAATTINSTAVTLSGSNANIRVGQVITGTGIQNFPYTYVAAISGTSLTLSQNATSTNASVTLSFFTPHGVVVGGGNNQATGSYSFIGGGGDAGTAANRNVASGDWSVVGGGFKNVASGGYSAVVGGYINTANNFGTFVGGGGYLAGSSYPNTASGQSASIVGGMSNTASGNASSVVGGYGGSASGTYSAVLGGSFGTTRAIAGMLVFSACQNPISQSTGLNQSSLLILAKQTTDATATVLCSDTNAAGTTNQVILPNNSAYYFRGEVISGVTGGGNTKGWFIEGVIKRGANAASTALVGTPTVTSNYADAGASTWTIAVTADTTNGGLRVTFTGQAGTTIRTVCQIRTTEMTF